MRHNLRLWLGLLLALSLLASCAPAAATPTAAPLPAATAASPTVAPTEPALPTPVPGATPGTREAPAQIGETVTGPTLNGYVHVFDTEVRLVHVLTGEEALRRLRPANPGLEPPPGYEYMFCYVRASIVDDPGYSSGVYLCEYTWRVVDARGQVYEPPEVLEPTDTPWFYGRYNSYSPIQGWLTLMRPVGEPVLLVLGPGPDFSAGVWFTVPADPSSAEAHN